MCVYIYLFIKKIMLSVMEDKKVRVKKIFQVRNIQVISVFKSVMFFCVEGSHLNPFLQVCLYLLYDNIFKVTQYLVL